MIISPFLISPFTSILNLPPSATNNSYVKRASLRSNLNAALPHIWKFIKRKISLWLIQRFSNLLLTNYIFFKNIHEFLWFLKQGWKNYKKREWTLAYFIDYIAFLIFYNHISFGSFIYIWNTLTLFVWYFLILLVAFLWVANHKIYKPLLFSYQNLIFIKYICDVWYFLVALGSIVS